MPTAMSYVSGASTQPLLGDTIGQHFDHIGQKRVGLAGLTLLQQAVATLTIKGKLERNKNLHLIINYGPGKEGTYKEGDVINVNLGSNPAPLRIRKITRYSVTLALNGAETTLNF